VIFVPIVGAPAVYLRSVDDKSQISLTDYQRILLGKAPLPFLGEVLVRTAVVYVFMTFVLRWMGKRMGGQISNLELAVMVALGAIVSLPMQALDGGLAPSGALLMCLLGLQRALSAAGARSKRVEETVQGKPSILLRDGVLELGALKSARISRWQLFSMLRTKKVRHLGQLKRVYLESGGVFSVLHAAAPQPGLPILPPSDPELSRDAQSAQGVRACAACGAVSAVSVPACPRCKANRWTYAMQDPQGE
jgi:uncharacterized membrane protein YcaP (DUF421 family)